jgi:hypothetical protein
MLLLLGAIGTATAPVAHAAPGDLCAIVGPIPTVEEDSGDLAGHGNGIDGKLLVGESYLFILYTEDDAAGPTAENVTASIDDEDGDADIESFVDNDGDGGLVGEEHVSISGVDVIPMVPVISSLDPDTADELDELYGAIVATDECAVDVTPVADAFAIIDVTCDEAGAFELTFYDPEQVDNSITGDYLCVANANTATLTATPTSVESAPARGNISHSLLLLTLTDSDGKPAAPGQAIDWSTDRCRIDGLTEVEYETDAPGDASIGAGALFAGFSATNEDSADAIEDSLSGHSGLTGSSTSTSFENDSNPSPTAFTMRTIAAAILHCEGAAPGVANVVAEIERSGPDLRATATVTVVGPPAFITMTAAPNRLVCGEKATILVTVTDAINQKVSDHTRVELITNYGGVIGGTGGTLGFPGGGPVNPLSSGAAETFGGVATAYLLTSSNHVGAYEVVAASGGGGLGGFFSTPVITSQVTVTCTAAAAPPVTAPNTGTGTISPPNTGDAGLAAASSSTASLFVIAGAVAFVLAGLASFGYARR